MNDRFKTWKRTTRAILRAALVHDTEGNAYFHLDQHRIDEPSSPALSLVKQKPKRRPGRYRHARLERLREPHFEELAQLSRCLKLGNRIQFLECRREGI